MLNKLTIKNRLTLVLVVSIVSSLYFSIEVVYKNYDVYKNMKKIKKTIILSTYLSDFVHETQKERGASAGFLGSKGKKFTSILPNQRVLTDEKFKKLVNFIKSNDIKQIDENIYNALNNIFKQQQQMEYIRNKVDTLSISLKKAINYYTTLNAKILNTISKIALFSKNAQIAKESAAYSAFLLSKERAGIERAVGSNVFAADKFAKGLKTKLITLISAQNSYMDIFLKFSDKKGVEFYKKTLVGNAVEEVNRMRNILLTKNSNFNVDPTYWFKTITAKINLLKKINDYLSNKIIQNASMIENSTFNKLFISLTIAIIAVILSIGIALFTSKSIQESLKTYFQFYQLFYR